jgi:predicted phage gp36 major capsid-like protein
VRLAKRTYITPTYNAHFGSNPRSTLLGRVVTKTRQRKKRRKEEAKAQKKLCGEAKERTKKDERFG